MILNNLGREENDLVHNLIRLVLKRVRLTQIGAKSSSLAMAKAMNKFTAYWQNKGR